MDTSSLVEAVTSSLPSGWRSARLRVSRRGGVALVHEGGPAAVGGEILERAQSLLDGAAEGVPFELELQEGSARCELLVGEPEEPLAWDDAALQFAAEVEDERKAAYEEAFGPFPEQVCNVATLVGCWPGGCLVQLPAETRVVHATFGLSNYGMPTPVGVYQGLTPAGDPCVELGPRRRRLVPAGVAGYGYELLMCTEKEEGWPLFVLARLAEKELLEDLDILGQVTQQGALTVEGIPIGPGGCVQVLVAPAAKPLPDSLTLANGRCTLLTATVITRAELEFSSRHGGAALRARLEAAGVGQSSSLERESV